MTTPDTRPSLKTFILLMVSEVVVFFQTIVFSVNYLPFFLLFILLLDLSLCSQNPFGQLTLTHCPPTHRWPSVRVRHHFPDPHRG